MSTKRQLILFVIAVASMSAAMGVHGSIFNNFISDTFDISADARGRLEFPRELPGLLVVLMSGLLCMLAVDHKEYIQMVYLLQSLEHEHTLAIKTDLPYDEPRVPTVSDIWRAAHWYERETHDLFGVEFEGNPDLSPLLLYEGFEGYPGRKEFPLHEYDEF